MPSESFSLDSGWFSSVIGASGHAEIAVKTRWTTIAHSVTAPEVSHLTRMWQRQYVRTVSNDDEPDCSSSILPVPARMQAEWGFQFRWTNARMSFWTRRGELSKKSDPLERLSNSR